jgi:hypothetical protein
MIGEWIAIGVIVIIGMLVLRLEHHARKYKIIVAVMIGLLLYFSVLAIFSSEQIDYTSPSGVISGVYLYAGWIGKTATSLWNIGTDTVHIVGNAIKINNTS